MRKIQSWHLQCCPITRKYVAELMLVPTQATGLGDMHSIRLHLLKDRADVGGNGRRLTQLRGFLALEIMCTRGLVDIPLASIVKISKLRWDRSATGITKLLRALRAERNELIAQCAEFELGGVIAMGPKSMTHDRRLRLIKKYDLVEESAMLLRRSLRANEAWKELGALGTNLAETIEHLGFDVRMNIVDELLTQNEEIGRRAWEPMTQLHL